MDLAYEVALCFMRRRPASRLSWAFGPGILLYGLARLAAASGDRGAALYEYVRDYHAHHRGRLPEVNWSDRCAPALSGLLLYEATGDTVGLAACRAAARYLATERRSALGTLEHLGRRTLLSRLYPRSIWVDSLAMYGVFAARYGQLVEDGELLDFAASQPAAFSALLCADSSGLFGHAYDISRRRPIPNPAVHWLRGNGFALVSMAEILACLPADHPRRPSVETTARRLGARLLEHQRESGLWSTIVDDPTSYEESSGSALCACGIARCAALEVLPARCLEAARRTREGLVRRVARRRGTLVLGGVSAATVPLGRSLYRLVPRRKTASHGVGALSLLASALGPSAARSDG